MSKWLSWHIRIDSSHKILSIGISEAIGEVPGKQQFMAGQPTPNVPPPQK